MEEEDGPAVAQAWRWAESDSGVESFMPTGSGSADEGHAQ